MHASISTTTALRLGARALSSARDRAACARAPPRKVLAELHPSFEHDIPAGAKLSIAKLGCIKASLKSSCTSCIGVGS